MQEAISQITLDHIFDEEISLTAITEYGISWGDIAGGKAEIPLNGARFDISFEGKLTGGKINGVIKGTDFLEIRADGKFMLDIRAAIITDDGEIIAVKEDGVSAPGPDGTARLNLNMHFSTISSKYSWLNIKQGWLIGEVDMIKGKVKMKGYIN